MKDKVEKDFIASKVCENICPNCGAGGSDIAWGEMENGEVTYQNATCIRCKCEFKEYWKYSDTEWDITERENRALQHRIEVRAYGYDIDIELCEQDGGGKWLGGSITTNLHEPDHVLPKNPEPADLAEAKEEQASIDAFNHMMDGIESFLLSLARHNVDVSSSVFVDALKECLEACGNNA
jgi:hypothetical protein